MTRELAAYYMQKNSISAQNGEPDADGNSHHWGKGRTEDRPLNGFAAREETNFPGEKITCLTSKSMCAYFLTIFLSL